MTARARGWCAAGTTAAPGAPRISSAPGIHRFGVWGSSGTLAVQPASALPAARALLRREVRDIDAACNRFRPDAELTRCNDGDGSPFPSGPRFLEAVAVALRVASATGGAVDPTVGRSLVDLGYDRDLGELGARATLPLAASPAPAPGWHCVVVDRAAGP